MRAASGWSTRGDQVRASVAAVALLLGCGDDAVPVHGGWVDAFVVPDSVARAGRDLTGSTVEVLVRGEDGWVSHEGTGSRDGRYWVEGGVEHGEPTLRIDGYYVPFAASRGGVELETTRGGRRDVIRSYDSSTRLELSYEQLDPWRPDDVLYLYSPGSGTEYFVREATGDRPPVTGATSLAVTVSHDRIPWGGPLLERSKGDVGTLLQLRTDLTELGTESSVVAAATVDADQVPAQTARASGSFEPIAPAAPAALSFDVPAFEQEIAGFETYFSASHASVHASPRHEGHWPRSPAAWLYQLTAGTSFRVLELTPVLPDLFPREWMWWKLGTTYARLAEIPGTSGELLYGGVFNVVPLDALEAASRPLLAMPTVRVDGQDLREAAELSTDAAIVFEGAAVASSAADSLRYSVAVYRLTAAPAGSGFEITVLEYAGTIASRLPSFHIPPGLVEPGGWYALVAEVTIEPEPGVEGSAAQVSAALRSY